MTKCISPCLPSPRLHPRSHPRPSPAELHLEASSAALTAGRSVGSALRLGGSRNAQAPAPVPSAGAVCCSPLGASPHPTGPLPPPPCTPFRAQLPCVLPWAAPRPPPRQLQLRCRLCDAGTRGGPGLCHHPSSARTREGREEARALELRKSGFESRFSTSQLGDPKPSASVSEPHVSVPPWALPL